MRALITSLVAFWLVVVPAARASATVVTIYTVTVVDARTHQALRGVHVSVRYPNFHAASREPVSDAVTDKNGQLQVLPYDYSSYQATLSKPGYMTVTVTGAFDRRNAAPIVFEMPQDQSGLSYCSNPADPGQTADVYIVCGGSTTTNP
jgi:hypothetical protein